jgi:hypothetical protein
LNETLLNEKYGLNGMNLAHASFRANEQLMITEALLANNNKICTLFIQVDNLWNELEPSFLASHIFMPFIYEDLVAKNYLQQKGYLKYYYIPFYKYISFEPKIGIRNVIMNLLSKQSISKTMFEAHDVNNYEGPAKYSYKLIDKMNPYIEKIITICKQNNINLMFYTAPIYNLESNNDIFYKYLTDYTDFSSIISDSTFFRDALHLNNSGAKLFTECFGKHYFE